jgi:hypothetical protein
MGTSGSSRGAGSNTSLVPTFLDEPQIVVFPGGGRPAPDDAEPDVEPSVAQPVQRPTIEPPPLPARFRGARRNFSSFAASAGADRGALRRAVSDYVRSGTRGSANATRRMGSSRAAAGNLLAVFRGLQRDGVEQTLRRLNLDNLIGRPAEEVLAGLSDAICRDGGSIDEGIARDAWLETVADLDRLGIDDVNTLTPEQIREFFLAFVAHAVETRLFQDIGAKGLRMAQDLASIEAFEAQFRDYIRRSVRDSFASDLAPLANLSDQQISEIVDRTYREAWELLDVWGDLEE